MGDEEQMKLCTNCARDIPAANFTIHSVYCSRNIAICPKCREPIPVVDMKTHLAHVPCKQCGEHIQRCDMAMHQSDACAQTAVQCSYCTLTLDRALMAEHEVYCGARTERCADCRELVMMKYRRLHEETNHGFIKLDDEPGPQPSWVVPVSNSNPSSQKAKPQIVRYTDQSPSNPPSNLQRQPSRPEEPGHKTDKPSSPGHLPAKRTNDMPQINSANDIDNAANHKDVSKPTSSRHSASKGAIKKYPAPQPPNGGKKHKEAKFKSSSDPEDAARHVHGVQHPPEFSQIRNLPMYMAMMREQNQLGEERTPRNLPPGPPVLNPPPKLEKLRTTNTSEIMETNGEKIKQTKNTQNHNVNNHLEFAYAPMSPEEMIKRLMGRDSTVLAANSPNGGASKPKNEDRRSRVSEHHYESVDFSPTGSPQADAPEEAQTPAQPVDRFMEIKNDLRSLRKELKECSSPLEVRKTVNVNQEAANLPAKNVNVIKGGGTRGDNLQLNLPAHNLGNVNQKTWNNQWNVASNQPQNQSAANFVKLPCEFCKVMVPSEQLVDHELHCHNEAANAYPEPNFPDSSPSPTSNTKNHLNQHTNLNPVPNNINGIPFSRIDDLRFKTPRHKKGRLQKNVDPNDLSPHNMVNDQANSWSKMRRKFQGADSDEFPSARRNENEVWNTSNERVDNDWANVRPHNARGDEDRPDNFARSPEDVENTDNNQVELNGVMIPCEFCNTVISAQDFVLHETGCNPIYTSIMPPKDQKNHNADNVPPNTPDGQPAPRNKPNRNPKKPLSQHEDERGLSDRPRRNRYQFEQLTEPRAVDVDWDEEAFGRCDDVQLPCEFCMLPIAASHLMEHQKLCFPEFH